MRMLRLLSLLFLVVLLHGGTVQGQWVQTNGPPGYTNCFAVSGTNLFGGITGGRGVYLSTDNGASWTGLITGLTNPIVNALVFSGTNFFAGAFGSGVYLSTNDGTSWTAVNNGLTNTEIYALAVSGTNLFAGTSALEGVFLSTNNGTNWTVVNNGLTSPNVRAFAVSGTNLFAGTHIGGVFLSTNNGTSWTEVNNGLTGSGYFVSAFAVSGTNLFAGTGGGVYLSTNNGTSWTEVNNGLTNTNVKALAVSGTNLFAGTHGGGVFLSMNNGTSWIAVNSGFPANTGVYSFAVSGMNLFAGTSGGAWRRPLSEMITSVNEISGEIPRHFALQQNYPNPFNPTTNIRFAVKEKSHVSLVVFNLLAQSVATLVNEELPAGEYEVPFSPNGLASGVYVYRMTTNGFVQSRRMLLLK